MFTLKLSYVFHVKDKIPNQLAETKKSSVQEE